MTRQLQFLKLWYNVDLFQPPDDLRNASYHIFRELFLGNSTHVMKKTEIKFAKRIAGLNLLKLNLARMENASGGQKRSTRHKSGFVYLISNPAFPGKYKVGITTDIERRLSCYQTYDPYRQFKIEHYVFVQDKRAEEKKILDMFQINLDRGEWVSVEQVKLIFLEYQ